MTKQVRHLRKHRKGPKKGQAFPAGSKVVAKKPENENALGVRLFTTKNLSLKSLVNTYIAILGVRGGGKSNTAAVIIEEFLSHNLPCTIVDIDGEHTGLKNKFKNLYVIKESNKPELTKIPRMVELILKKRVPVLLDLSEFSSTEIKEFLLAYLKSLWDWEDKFRIPHFLFLEEAHEFIPQNKQKSELKDLCIRIALRGRKRGLGAAIISQRTARVDKDVLTQAEHYILHKVHFPNDVKVYEELLPATMKKELRQEIMKLQPGQVIYVSGGNAEVLSVRKRITPHGGHSPGIELLKPLGKLSWFNKATL